MKVSISAGGREVDIETTSEQNITYAEVADKALEVWKQTEGATRGTEGPAYGFSTERRHDRPPSTSAWRSPDVVE